MKSLIESFMAQEVMGLETSRRGNCGLPQERRAAVLDGSGILAALAMFLTACGSGGSGYYPNGGGDGPPSSTDMAGMIGIPPDLASAPQSPCGNIPTSGACVSSSEVETCVVPTGQGLARVVMITCQSYETCDFVNGQAKCVPRQGACEPGITQCTDANNEQVCVNGAWMLQPCPGCQAAQLGVVCPGNGQPTTLSGHLAYEFQGPNQNLTDWDPTVGTANAQEFLIIALSCDANRVNCVPVGSTVTDASGNYTVTVPANPKPSDLFTAWAVKTTPGGALAYAVAVPDIPDGQWNVAMPIPNSAKNTPWFWYWGLAATVGSPNLTITENNGSGAARVFDYLRYIHESAQSLNNAPGKSLVIWLRYNTSWSCGSCFAPSPTSLKGYNFDSQMFLPALAQDTSYWADPVTAHENGHWLMSSYGTSPGEGGSHTVGCTSPPGMAWSEGWATGFSSLARSNSIYYDKQQGSFFWLDIAQRRYSNAQWQRPDPNQGLLQLIDENEVSAMIWQLASNPGVQGQSLISNQAFFDALRSPRLNQAPFARGYTRHSWTAMPGSCEHLNLVDTGESVPMFADFLDALDCAGYSKATIDQATDPQQSYPYPSNAPLCQ